MSASQKFKHIPEQFVRTKADRDFLDQGGQWLPERGEKVVRFIETYLVPTRGPGADKPVKLLPWQRDELILPLFSYIKKDNYRRFTEGCCFLPRQNGKSTISAAISTYMLAADDEPGSTCLIVACTGYQTGVVFKEILNSVKANDQLKKIFKVRESLREIDYPAKNGTLKGLSNDGWSKLGNPPHCAVLDEFAFWESYVPFQAIKTGTGSRRQPLIFAISTSGHDRTTPAYEWWQFAQSILDGGSRAQSFFPLIYSAHQDDDPFKIETVRKANPSCPYVLPESFFKDKAERAKTSKIEELDYRQFYLNQWVTSVNQFLNLDAWAKCKRQIPNLAGRESYMAVDLSTTGDLTNVGWITPDAGGFYFDYHAFCCREGATRRNAQNLVKYSVFEAEGSLTIHSGNCINFDDVRAFIRRKCKEMRVKTIVFDPSHNAADTMLMLKSEG